VTEELVMPRLSDTMESGTVSRWLKGEGDSFVTGDVLAEIETDKAVMELSAYDDGVLLKILVGDGESADLGAPIAMVGEDGAERSDASETEAGSGSAEQDAPVPEAEAPEAEAESNAGPEATSDEDEAAAEDRGSEGRSDEGRSDGGDGETTTEPPAADAETGKGAASAGTSRTGLKASPIARRMALDADVDLRSLAGKGSGPEGRIVKADVERLIEEAADGAKKDGATEAPDEASAPKRPAEKSSGKDVPTKEAPKRAGEEGELLKPSRMLQTVARRMQQSKQTAPHFYLETSVDMTNALAARRQVNAAFSGAVKVSVNDLMLRAAGLALLEHPRFHRSWTDEGILQHRTPNVGMAVALEDGLIVPVVRDIASKSLRAISEETKDLASRARDGRLKQSEIEGGTFTVSNLGMFGITRFNGIINLPEPGILSVAATVDTPVAVDGEVVVRPMLALSLSVDHRAASGADGARFLATVKRILESGAGILA
jgi:pyruvate dehydrogenase E2 component (dihydrolipoamide acetyltransferase)